MRTHHVSTQGFGAVESTPEILDGLVHALEVHIKGQDQEQIKVTHQFGFHLYIREMVVPAGFHFTGRVHKQDDFQVIFYGDISVLTAVGLVRLEGPNSYTSRAGVKPYGRTWADTRFATIHHTRIAHPTLDDLDEIERELFEDEIGMLDFKTGEVLQEVLSCQA